MITRAARKGLALGRPWFHTLVFALTLLTALLGVTTAARAEAPVLVLSSADSYDVGAHARVFAAAKEETIGEYEALRDAGRFSTPAGKPSRRLHEGGDVWIVIEVVSAATAERRDWVLWKHGSAQWLDARIQIDGGEPEIMRNGFFVPPQDRPVQGLGYAFPLRLSPGARAEIVLRGYLPPRETHELFAASAPRFGFQSLVYSLLVFGILGAALALGIYNAILYVAVRERAYAYYAAYALCSVFLWSSTLSVLTVFTRNGPLALTLNGLSVMVTAFAALRFTHEFLELRRTAPRVHVVFQISSVLIGVLTVLLFVLPQAEFKKISSVLGIPIMAAIVTAPIYALVKGHRRARLMVVGWAPLMSLPVLIGVQSLGLIEGSWMSKELLLIFHGFEILSMALAIGDRFRELDTARVRAQNEALEQLRLRLAQTEQLAEAEFASHAAREEAERERLKGSTDALTGLRNRRAFESEYPKLNNEWTDDRSGDVLLCVIDVDGLKAINDRAGHAEGDRLLVSFGKHLASSLRGMDRVYRLGGDEFAVFARAPDATARKAIESRIRGAVEQLKREFPDAGASLGSALLSETEGSLHDAYRLADERMYREKRTHHGTRNGEEERVESAESQDR
jgi:two-component system, sensor histidine kinase LadS